MKEKKLKKIYKKEKRLIKKREKEYIAFGKKIQKQFNINGKIYYYEDERSQCLNFYIEDQENECYTFLMIDVTGDYFQGIEFDSEYISAEKVNEIEKILR